MKLVIILLISSRVHVENHGIFPHFVKGGYLRFLQMGSVIFTHILMCVLGYLEEILEVKCYTCLSKYVKYGIDLVVGNEVLLDNRVLDTSEIKKYCLTRRVT